MNKKSLLQMIYQNSDDLLEKVQKFIIHGEKLSHITKHDESPLRVASNNGRFDVVKLLIDAGADKTQLGWSNSFYEVVFGSLATIQESIEKYQDRSVFCLLRF